MLPALAVYAAREHLALRLFYPLESSSLPDFSLATVLEDAGVVLTDALAVRLSRWSRLVGDEHSRK